MKYTIILILFSYSMLGQIDYDTLFIAQKQFLIQKTNTFHSQKRLSEQVVLPSEYKESEKEWHSSGNCKSSQ